jgi:hypothetical protein
LFPRMKSKLKGRRFQMSLKFRNNRWRSYLRFQKVSSSGASSNGRNAGPVA